MEARKRRAVVDLDDTGFAPPRSGDGIETHPLSVVPSRWVVQGNLQGSSQGTPPNLASASDGEWSLADLGGGPGSGDTFDAFLYQISLEEDEVSEDTSGETRPTGEESASATPTQGQDQLRCLDSSHAASCACCIEPPSQDVERSYELVSDAEKSTGERRVRHLLTKTPEWSSAAERARLAAICDEEPGMESLAQALRNKACSALRKAHMFYLVRAWGYRSDLWAPRNSRNKRNDVPDAAPSAARVPAASRPMAQHGAGSAASLCCAAPGPTQAQQQPALAQQQPCTQPPPPQPQQPQHLGLAAPGTGRSLELQCVQVIMPLAGECTRAAAGYAACKAAYEHGGDHLTEEAAQLVARNALVARSVSVSWRAISEKVRGTLAILDAECMAPGGSTILDAPACEQCLSKATPGEGLVNVLAAAIQESATYNKHLTAATEAEAAWVAEMAVAYKTALLLMANALSVIAQGQLIPLREGIVSYLLVLDCLIQWSINLEAAWHQRENWMRAYMRKCGAGSAAVCIMSDTCEAVVQANLNLKYGTCPLQHLVDKSC